MRKAMHKTQKQVAAECGMDRKTVVKIEKIGRGGAFDIEAESLRCYMACIMSGYKIDFTCTITQR